MVDFTTWRSLIDGASVIPDSVVDNFEDADSNPTGVYGSGEGIADYYGGTTADWSRSDTRSFDGSKSLYASGRPGSIGSTSGLNRYPSRGESFETRMWFEDGSERGIRFAVGSEPNAGEENSYAISVRQRNDDIRINKRENGNFNELSNPSVTIPASEWVRLEVDWGETTTDDITVILENESGTQLVSDTVADTTFDSGGIGFNGFDDGGGRDAYVDEVHVI